MDAPAAFRDGHALDAVHAAFEFQFRQHALAGDAGDDLLVAADLGGAGRDKLDPPALLPGTAPVPPEQAARDQSPLAPPRPGAALAPPRPPLPRPPRPPPPPPPPP